jgi:hypothetical protein
MPRNINRWARVCSGRSTYPAATLDVVGADDVGSASGSTMSRSVMSDSRCSGRPGSSPRAGARTSPNAAVRTSVRSQPVSHRSTTSPAVGGATDRTLGRSRAGGVGVGCVSPPDHRRDRSRTPRASRSSSVPDTRCTTGTIAGFGARHATGSRTRDGRESAGSSRESGAALGAAVLDDVPAGARAHTSTEPVLAGTALGVRLVRTLHLRLLVSAGRKRCRPPRSACSGMVGRATAHPST